MAVDEFQAQVQVKIEKLRQESLRELEAELCEKRAEWARRQLTTRSLPATPRAAVAVIGGVCQEDCLALYGGTGE